MASVSLPAPHPRWLADQHDLDTHRYSMPIPNPTFSFPPQPDHPDGPSPARQPAARAPLPAFSFPQAPAEPSTPPLLPSVSPSSSAPSSPQRPVTPGHRRRPSGHVRSGSGREDVSGMVGINTNSNNNNSGGNNNVPALPCMPPSLPPPPQSSFLPPPGPGLSGQPTFRRSHAHRRSAAISSVDLTAVTKAFPPMPIAGSSAPTTPADMKQQHLINNEDLAKSTARTFPSTGPRSPLLGSPDTVDRAEDDGPAAPPVSAPVPAFHRPLSTISSDSSASTIRPAIHVKQQSGVEPSMKDLASTRPKTAGATVSQSAQQFTTDDRIKRPVSASGHATPVASDVPPVPKLPAHLNIPFTSAPGSDDPESPQPSSEKKSTKKKKVRSWAGILTRKSKKRAQKKATPPRLSPTPPLPTLTRTNSAVGSLVDLDTDNLIVIHTPTFPNGPLATDEPSSVTVPSLETSWKPPSFYEQGQDSDVFSPVIDLDAALGPFNTPEMGPEAGRASGFSVATKRMYSGGRRGQFVGPEMRYHRRAESAPEMPPVDRTRLGPIVAMGVPDVFDEEEEDAFLAENGAGKSAQQDQKPVGIPDEKSCDDGELGLGIQIVDSSSRPSTVHEDLPITPNDNNNLAGNTSDTPPPRDAVHIVDADQLTLRLDKRSDASTPPVRSPLLEAKRPSTSPDFGVPKFGLPSELPPSMANLPSPDPDTVSLEVPRLMTASSSITDRQTFSSGYSGEPYSDYYPGSTDDVPSLASAASASTGNIPRVSSPFYSRSTTDPTHVTPRRPRSGYSDRAKRASLVSLTKLISGSTGERSKLSYEHKADDIAPEKIKKKAHRFSRLMTFWKDKEKDPKESE